MSLASDRLAAVEPRSGIERRSKFALGMALAMLAINLVGFGPTLYLRALFDVPPIPAYLYLHGLAGTAWFVLLVVQASLVAKRRVRLHQTLGWIGAAIAAALLISGVYTSTNLVPRHLALGPIPDADITLFGLVTAADNAAFIVFPLLVLLAVYWRRRSDVHKRLMLIASFSIVTPAVVRIASWYGPFPNPISVVLVLGLLASFFIYDFRSRGRPHVATVFGVLLFVLVNAGMRLSGMGPALVESRMQSAQSE